MFINELRISIGLWTMYNFIKLRINNSFFENCRKIFGWRSCLNIWKLNKLSMFLGTIYNFGSKNLFWLSFSCILKFYPSELYSWTCAFRLSTWRYLEWWLFLTANGEMGRKSVHKDTCKNEELPLNCSISRIFMIDKID